LLTGGIVAAGPPRLGVTVQEISGQLAGYFKLPAEHGLLVTAVEKDGPADKAGIRAGDVILKLGGKEVEGARELRAEVDRVEAGQELVVGVQRDGKAMDVPVAVRGPARRARRHDPA
jgi:serine protease Do